MERQYIERRRLHMKCRMGGERCCCQVDVTLDVQCAGAISFCRYSLSDMQPMHVFTEELRYHFSVNHSFKLVKYLGNNTFFLDHII